MDNTIARTVRDASELLKTGKKAEARAILVPIVKQNPEIAQAWYLLGFTVTDVNKSLYCFQQVLRIDPSHQAAQKQIARLTPAQRVLPDLGTFQVDSFSGRAPAFAPSSSPAPSKKQLSKNRLLLLLGIALAVVVLIAGFGATALYVSNGMNLNQQVDALFAQRKCVEVVQYSTFEESFPRAVFSSLFGVYHQIEECQARLALEQAIQTQDWPAAYSVIENYLVAHPQGAFLAEMSEQAGTILFSWSKNLMAQTDYKAATEKLELLQKGFPTSSVAPVALKILFDDYLLWAKYSYEQKNYQNAEQVLKLVGWHEKASPEQVKQADDGLVAVYLQWGKAQAESGQYDKAIEYYENARALNPGFVDYDRLKHQIPLIQADVLAKTADFDGALAIVKKMQDETLPETSKEDAVAERAKLLDAYTHSLSPQARAQMTAAATNMCKRQPPTTAPIFAKDPGIVRFAIVAPLNLQLPSDWTAKTPSELHYIVCIEQSQRSIEACSKKGNTAQRYRSVWEVRLYDVLTAEPYQATNISGSRPGDCDQAGLNDIYGNPPKIQQVVDWLSTLNILK